VVVLQFADKFRSPCPVRPAAFTPERSSDRDSVLGVIAQIESGMKPHAMRFDRRLFNVLSQELHELGQARADARFARHCNSCDIDTALVICSTRYGLFQLSGSQIYGPDLRLDAPIASFLGNAELQGEAVRRLLAARRVDYSPAALAVHEGRLRFAAAFRGSATYAEQLRLALDAFGVLPPSARAAVSPIPSRKELQPNG
jgi:hypothetical protein